MRGKALTAEEKAKRVMADLIGVIIAYRKAGLDETNLQCALDFLRDECKGK